MSSVELEHLLGAWLSAWRAAEPGTDRRKIAADMIEYLEALTFGDRPHALGSLLEF